MGYPASGRLFLFTRDADRSPGYGIQTRQADFSFTDRARTVIPVIDSFNGSFDSTKQFCIDLEKPQIYMDLVIVAGLIHKISVPRVLHIVPVGFLARSVSNGVAFLLKRGLEFLEILLVHLANLEMKKVKL